MCAAQLDELPSTNEAPDKKSDGGGLMPALIAIILAPLLSAGVMIVFFKLNEKPAQASSVSGDSQPLNMESSGDLQYFELTGLITNLGGPIKSRYINVELKLEGLAREISRKYLN